MTDGTPYATIVGWRMAILCGVLWGCALAGLELSVELGEWLGFSHFLYALLGLIGVWCLTGIGWATMAKLATPGIRTLPLIALWLLGCAIFTLAQLVVLFMPIFDRFFDNISNFPKEAIGIHVLWLNAFYGGIYVVGHAAFSRSLRSRRQVSRLLRVLGEEAAALSETRLRTAHTGLQPRLLVDALALAKARYRQRPAAADRIVEQLILFLRAASGAPRLQPATLDDELRLAAAYVGLQAALREGKTRWTVDLAAPAPDLFFPSRLLVPTIERLGREASHLALTSGYGGDGFYVAVSTKSIDPPASSPACAQPLPERAYAASSDAPAWTFATSNIDTGVTWTALAGHLLT